MSLRINDVSGIAGMIQPNARVDILLTMNPNGDAPRVAKLFMSNMRVLAMGTQSQPGEDGRPIPTTVATARRQPRRSRTARRRAGAGHHPTRYARVRRPRYPEHARCHLERR
ncbi:MAG: RcpC/CpaB family pilus assembly protein [Gemmatimonadaceae bacterium]